MITMASSALAASLRTMIDYCRQISSLLENDSEYFIKNNLNAIENSNAQKMAFMDKLAELTTQIHASCPQGLSTAISEQDVSSQQELTALIEQLRTEIFNCHKHLEVNGSMVFANLQMLKDIWDKLIASKSDDQVYNLSGNIVGK